MALFLEGDGLRVLKDLWPAKRTDWAKLQPALQCRFGAGECQEAACEDAAMDLRCLARHGHPTAVHEELALSGISTRISIPQACAACCAAVTPCYAMLMATEPSGRTECVLTTWQCTAAKRHDNCYGWVFCAGCLGQWAGLYVNCVMDNFLVCALIDTGSTIALIRGRLLGPHARENYCMH